MGQRFTYLCTPFFRGEKQSNEKNIPTFGKKESKQARVQKENGECERSIHTCKKKSKRS